MPLRRLRAERHYRLLQRSRLFDRDFYLRSNLDVAASGRDPLAHYCEVGGRERRDPNAFFDTAFYLAQLPAREKVPPVPLVHYLRKGARRGYATEPRPAELRPAGSARPAKRSRGTLEIRSLAEYCAATGASYHVVVPAGESAVYAPVGPGEQATARAVAQPEIYVAELRDVGVLGSEVPILAADGIALLDAATREGASRQDLTTRSVHYCQGRTLQLHARNVSPESIPRGVMLSGFGSSNYLHWMLEYLPRLALVERFPEYADAPLLVDRACMAVPQLRDALARFQTTPRRVIELEPRTEYRVQRLIVPSNATWLPLNLRPGLKFRPEDTLVSALAVATVRQRLAGHLRRSRDHADAKLFLSRSHNSRRRISNEPEIDALFRKLGFQVIRPETLSLREQIAAFGRAAVIAGGSGAGFTNLAFAPAAAKVLSLTAEQNASFSLYSTLAQLCGQQFVTVLGGVHHAVASDYHDDYRVAPERVLEALAAWLD